MPISPDNFDSSSNFYKKRTKRPPTVRFKIPKKKINSFQFPGNFQFLIDRYAWFKKKLFFKNEWFSEVQ